MKDGIHPSYRDVCFVDLSNGFKFVTRSCAQTKEMVDMEDGRKLLYPMDEIEAMEFILEKMKATKNNLDFFDMMRRGG